MSEGQKGRGIGGIRGEGIRYKGIRRGSRGSCVPDYLFGNRGEEGIVEIKGNTVWRYKG